MQPTAPAVEQRSKKCPPQSGRKKPSTASDELRLIPIPLADEIQPGDSLADKLLASLRRSRLASNPATSWS